MRRASLQPKHLDDTRITAYQLVEISSKPDESSTLRSYGIAKADKLLSFDSLVTRIDFDLNSSSSLLHPNFHGPPSEDDLRLVGNEANEQLQKIWQRWTACEKSAGYLAVAFGLLCCVMIAKSQKAVSSSEQPQIQEANASNSPGDAKSQSGLPERPLAHGLSCSKDSTVEIILRDTDGVCVVDDGGASQ